MFGLVVALFFVKSPEKKKKRNQQEFYSKRHARGYLRRKFNYQIIPNYILNYEVD